MALCRLMIDDFKYNRNEDYWKYPIGYDDNDLRCGISWAHELLSIGIKFDLFWEIDLRTFIKWAKHKLKTAGENNGIKRL